MTDIHGETPAVVQERETIIVGAGLSGMIAGALFKKGSLDFLILEGADEVGGTWRWTNYPGAGTDTEAMTYFPTFAPGKTKYRYATRDELFDYCVNFSQEHVGREHIQFNCTVKKLEYSSQEQKWTITTNLGIFKSRFIIHATAGLNVPKNVAFPGQELFKGQIVHSAYLGSDLEFFKNKRVGIVGLGASTLQLAPSIAGIAKSVTVFRRTIPFIIKYKRKLAPKN